MIGKPCNKCGVYKSLEDYYPNSKTADHREGICKDCRRKRQREYSKTDAGKLVEQRRNQTLARSQYRKETTQRWIKAHPEKRRAQNLLWKAILKGEIQRKTVCEECGRSDVPIHAHHSDYSTPLEVEWLCIECHGKRNPLFLSY